MARPLKEGLDYFPMDTNLDDKIRAVESVFKNDGFVWIVKFWQAAYKTNTGEVCLDGYHGVIHAENSRVTHEKQSEILKLCIEIGLLYKTESGNYTSNGIQKRIKHIMAERERWRNKEENELSPEIIPEITPEIRGEIKLKETKLKDYSPDFKEINGTSSGHCPDASASASSSASASFLKPTLEEVREYCRERKNMVNPDRWMAHYQSNGWKVGRNSMKNWKAAVRTWEQDSPKSGPTPLQRPMV